MPGAQGVPSMKRLLCLIAALCLCASAALAQTVVEGTPITGACTYPEGSDVATAAYVFRYAFPQFTADSPQAAAINAYYAALAGDMADAALADAAGQGEDQPQDSGAPGGYTALDYRITAATEDYLSVLLTSRQFLGNTETESWTGNVFALNGVYAGQAVSLSQAMGLEQEDGAAASATSYAAQLVYRLVWQIIGDQQAMQSTDYFPELTQADLERVFSPESDFYLDADGNFVFYVQSGQIASEVEGVLTYPFSMAEVLSAVGQ